MNIKCIFFAVSLVILVLVLPGCGDPGQEGFPCMFGPTRMLDPVNQPAGSGSNDVTIYVKDSDEDSIDGVSVDLDGTTEIAYSGYAYFYNLSPGRHLVKASYDGWVEKITLLNLPGDGENMDFTITMQSNNDGGGGDDGGTPDSYEPNDTFSNSHSFNNNYNYFDQQLNGRISSSGDWDIFSFTCYIYDSVEIWLDNIPLGCDYDIKLYQDNLGNFLEIDSSNYGSNADEYINKYITTPAGTYYLKIYTDNGEFNYSADYRLRIRLY